MIDIENTLPDGFEHKGHFEYSTRMMYLGDRYPTARLYNNFGNEMFLKGKTENAIRCNERTQCIFGKYESGLLNNLNLLDKIRAEKNNASL